MKWQRGFLAGLDESIAWQSLLVALRPVWEDPRFARLAVRPEVMLRIFVLQRWLDLSAREAEVVLRQRAQLRRFVGLAPDEAAPDASCMDGFAVLLDLHHMTDMVRSAIPRALGSPDAQPLRGR